MKLKTMEVTIGILGMAWVASWAAFRVGPANAKAQQPAERRLSLQEMRTVMGGSFDCTIGQDKDCSDECSSTEHPWPGCDGLSCYMHDIGQDENLHACQVVGTANGYCHKLSQIICRRKYKGVADGGSMAYRKCSAKPDGSGNCIYSEYSSSSCIECDQGDEFEGGEYKPWDYECKATAP